MSSFIRCLQGLNLQFAVAIRSNHGARLPAEQKVRANKWRKERADIFRWEPRNSLDSRNYLWEKESLALLANYKKYRHPSRKVNLYVMTKISGFLAKEGGNYIKIGLVE
jgi:hypothetical protein